MSLAERGVVEVVVAGEAIVDLPGILLREAIGISQSDRGISFPEMGRIKERA